MHTIVCSRKLLFMFLLKCIEVYVVYKFSFEIVFFFIYWLCFLIFALLIQWENRQMTWFKSENERKEVDAARAVQHEPYTRLGVLTPPLLPPQGNDNYTGLAARDTANALEVLAAAVRGVAATTSDADMQQRVTAAAADVMDKSANLILEAKKAVNNPNNPDNQTRLAQVRGGGEGREGEGGEGQSTTPTTQITRQGWHRWGGEGRGGRGRGRGSQQPQQPR